MNRIAVRTRRLVLRPLKKSDYYKWLEYWTIRYVSQSKWDVGPFKKSKITKKRFEKVIIKHHQAAKEDDFYWYGVFEKKSGKLIGEIDYNIFLRSTHQFANFGYVIHNMYWGKGYGQEAAKAGLKIGFRDLRLNRLEAAINLDNKKSIRLVKSIGMRREGIKKRYWYEYGKWFDHLIYVANPEDIGLKALKPKI